MYVLADDVYVGSYLSPSLSATPIAAIDGVALGAPALGAMSAWTFTVVTPSKTFALPTARVAFATTRNWALLKAVGHYRTVFSLGRVPQVTELTAAAALCLTPQTWIDSWNTRYRTTLWALAQRIAAINTQVGMGAFRIQAPEGGWYLPLRISPALFPGGITSSVDAFAVLLHYGRGDPDTGIAMLPGELFDTAHTMTDSPCAGRSRSAAASWSGSPADSRKPLNCSRVLMGQPSSSAR